MLAPREAICVQPVGPFSVWVLLAATGLLVAVTALAVARHLRAALALRPLLALTG